ncbi:MAG: hypothetical protein HXS53_03125 [Theionarchaea archaeon]|nr:hypothetical protein [Theionarchaea archaeon]
MQAVSLKEKMQGIKGVLLADEGIVLYTDMNSTTDSSYYSWLIKQLLESIQEKKGDVSSICIDGENKFFIFINGTRILAIMALPGINMPLLKILARETLERIESETHEIEEVDEIEKRAQNFL